MLMLPSNRAPERAPSLLNEIEDLIRRTTHGRIRGLAVEEVQGQIRVSGRAPSYHIKQLVLHAVLAMPPGEDVCAQITVG